jgi:hypothetical protein
MKLEEENIETLGQTQKITDSELIKGNSQRELENDFFFSKCHKNKERR